MARLACALTVLISHLSSCGNLALCFSLSVETDRRASERIAAVKEFLSSSLRSTGTIHSLPEKEILEKGEQMRAFLDYLLIEISEKKNRTANAREALKGLLNKGDRTSTEEDAKEKRS